MILKGREATKCFCDFMKAIRQGILGDEARKRIGYKMKPDEKIKVLRLLVRENDFDVSSYEFEQDMKNEDVKHLKKKSRQQQNLEST